MNVFCNFLIGEEVGPVAIFCECWRNLTLQVPTPLCRDVKFRIIFILSLFFSSSYWSSRGALFDSKLWPTFKSRANWRCHHKSLKTEKNMWKYILCFAFVLDLKVCLHLIYLLGCGFFCNLLRLYPWVVNYHLKFL